MLTSFGHYASVLKVSPDLAIAISTDGVGSKTIVASRLGRYDTIGYDCMAMNVNDVICVGARPIALVDYLGVHTLDAGRADEILRGLGAAAKEAGVAIPGGELAQLPEVIGSDGQSPGDETAFDLVGTCIGTVHPDKLVLGHDIAPGDAIIGIRSSGVHSNGLTLARRALIDWGGHQLNDEVTEIGRTVGEELLEPTQIYVRALTSLWDAGVPTHGIAHITSDGFVNLCRLESEVTYVIDDLPDPHPIFGLIQKLGSVADEEMYRVFNMGVGMVVVVPNDSVDDALRKIIDAGYEPKRIGTVEEGPREVRLTKLGLTGSLAGGDSVFRR